MKSFLNKILILASLALIMPFFSYSAPVPAVTCSSDYSSDLTGKTITFTAHVNNSENYDYFWNGEDGEDGRAQSLNHLYTTEGLKTVSVIASSTDSSNYLTTTCSVNIYDLVNLPDYTASCTPNTDRAVIGQDITWVSSVNGPLAPYSIVWTGTDGLTSSEFTYASSGIKTAKMVSFQSRYGNETNNHNIKLSNINCSASVEVISEEIHNPTRLSVSGSCSAASASQYLNNVTTWNSNLNISGGVAPYTIDWVDNEGDLGTGTSVSKVYSMIGTKNASLIVGDDAGQEVRLDCGSVTISRRSSSGGSTVITEDIDSGSTNSTSTTSTTTNPTDTNSTSTNNLNNNIDLVVPKPVAVITDTTATIPTMVGANVGNTTEDDSGLTGQEATVLGALDGISGTSTDNSFTASVFSAISGNIMYILGILILLGLIVWFLFWIKRRKENKLNK